MKKITYQKYKALLTISAICCSQTVLCLNTVNFRTNLSINNDPQESCSYSNILNRTSNTLDLSQRTINNRSDNTSKECINRIGNLNRLNESQTQKKIASILTEIQCIPDMPIDIFAQTTKSPDYQKYYGTKNDEFIWHIKIDGCLVNENGENISLGPDCTDPHEGNIRTSQFDYDKLIKFFQKCRDSINKKVADQKLLQKWSASNNPNKHKGSKNTNHTWW